MCSSNVRRLMYSELALYIVADILYILYAISLVKCRATAYYFRNNSVAVCFTTKLWDQILSEVDCQVGTTD